MFVPFSANLPRAIQGCSKAFEIHRAIKSLEPTEQIISVKRQQVINDHDK